MPADLQDHTIVLLDEERSIKASISSKLILQPRTNPRNDKDNSLDQNDAAQHTVGSRNYVPHKGANYIGTKKEYWSIQFTDPSWTNPASATSTDIQSSARPTSARHHPQIGPGKKCTPQHWPPSKRSRTPPPPHLLSIPAKRNKKEKEKNSAGKEGRKEGRKAKPASSGPRPSTKGESVKGKERRHEERKTPRITRRKPEGRTRAAKEQRQPSPKRKDGQKGRKEGQTKRNSGENVPCTGTGTMVLPLGAVAVCPICGGVSQ
ncbi:hypothetical protein B0H16DRAFT_1481150 [Mycena metata]|uniref:Uncharacterized protein n=1 Tax=Mycena metata TaxID=1033252 RepID=A0AAD7MBB8_9AGAR|nr:hypothetical protein B0H16DRAFT_1481150 [Mycena metata]